MPCPFPGMDPFLEGPLSGDVHQALATEIRNRLTPQIRPRYVARLAITTIQDETSESEIGIIYPGVEILRQTPRRVEQPFPPPTGGVAVAEATIPVTPPLTVPLLDLRVRLVTVEVHDVEDNQLITSIEILSPVNKREPGLTQYRQKRDRLMAAGVHLLEIDLIRRGQRPMMTARVVHRNQFADTPYLVTLTRSGASSMEIWPVRLSDKLPIVAVPLRPPDPDVSLDLGAALATIYEQAAYDLSIDYMQSPPPPPFDERTNAWMDHLLAPYRQQT